MYIDVLTMVLVLVLAAEVLLVFQMVRKASDSELQAVCTSGGGPSMTFKQGVISDLIGGLNPLPKGTSVPAQDLTVTAQLNCEQDA